MITVQVTQFVLPHGRKQEVTTQLPDACAPLYEAMTKAGCHFEAEVLRTGNVSVTITDSKGDDGEPLDIDISLTANGPDVPKGMVQLLERRAWEQMTATE